MRKHLFCAVVLLMMSGCGGTRDDSTVPFSPDATGAVSNQTVSISEETSTSIQTSASSFSSSVSLSENGMSSLNTSQTDLLPVSSTTLVSLAQGGQGGEAHASDPDPDYFTYRFFPDSVSMRLAGGNYQTIFYDFADAVDHYVDEIFYLADFDFDGKSDLAVPVRFEGLNTTFAVFQWDSDRSMFENDPVLLINPSVIYDQKKVHCISYDSVTGYEKNLQILSWEDHTPVEICVFTADYTALTLTENTSDGDNVQYYDSEAILREAMVTILSGI